MYCVHLKRLRGTEKSRRVDARGRCDGMVFLTVHFFSLSKVCGWKEMLCDRFLPYISSVCQKFVSERS
jgi:hypothetical protein